MVYCPHCKQHPIKTAKVPKDVVAVMPCPACNEWVVLFRERAIGVSRRIIEQGTREERREHLADVIGKFLDAGILDARRGGADETDEALPPWESATLKSQAPDGHPITREEVDQFVGVDLRHLDNAEYFHKHFG